MGFLNRFSSFFKRFSSTKRPDDFSHPVESAETVTRFVCYSRHLYLGEDRAKPSAYLPRNGMTSVFRTAGLDVHAIQRLGEEHLKQPAPIAAAESTASLILDTGLRFKADNIPARHANIIGWPTRKEEQRLLALKIVASARVVRYN
jgi:hypothetical protein